jgi:hypothetical protein
MGSCSQGRRIAIRIWREGVLVQRMCIAKTTEMYFTAEEARQPCGTDLLLLSEFWMWHQSGNLDAQICNNHAAIVVGRMRSYLRERVDRAVRMKECWWLRAKEGE